MAKKKGGVNKSAAIRRVLEGNPKMEAAEVISTLAAQGIVVSRPNVYMVKGRMGGNKARRRQARRAVARAAGVTGSTDALNAVRKAKELADQVGGIWKLKELVDILAG